jgi:acetylornithine/succinyldiaminopimelate/putrescine aminotransferase
MTALNPARADLLATFGLDLALATGAGCRLTGEDGRDYLDFLAQYGALPFGHNPPAIWAALAAAREAGAPAMLQPLRNLAAERLAARLAEVTPGDLGIVTFTNSGAETVEAAIKLARVRTGRSVIVATHRGFHGKTLGALSATGNPAYQRDFDAPAPGFDHVPYGDLDALRARLGQGDVAGFIVEPIQGEGGVHVPPEGYIDAAIALCREAGAVDRGRDPDRARPDRRALRLRRGREVPDMLLLAKALGGGLVPIGALSCGPGPGTTGSGGSTAPPSRATGSPPRRVSRRSTALLADDGALIRAVRENGRRLGEGLARCRPPSRT